MPCFCNLLKALNSFSFSGSFPIKREKIPDPPNLSLTYSNFNLSLKSLISSNVLKRLVTGSQTTARDLANSESSILTPYASSKTWSIAFCINNCL